MSKWILPMVLTVEDVNNLSSGVLSLFTKISTGIVLKKVNEFINSNIDSLDIEIRSAAEKLKDAYAEINAVNDYLESDEAKDLADTLSQLNYSDISINTDLSKLKLWRSLIIELLAEDEEFLNSYTGDVSESSTRGFKSAYTAKLDKDNLEVILEKMRNVAGNTPSEFSAYSRLEGAILKNKNLFKNGNFNVNHPTVLRKAIIKKDRLISLLRGLDFIIPKIESGKNATAWRRL